MSKEIEGLSSHGTCKVIKRSSLPEGANILSSIWVFKIKRTPSGLLRKSKARFGVRGDQKIEGVNFFEMYAPVVSMSTVRMSLCLSIQYEWATKQVDFSNAFFQATLKEYVYVSLPIMFRNDSGIDNNNLALKLNKSLSGLRQRPLSWYNHLDKGLQLLDFKPSPNEPRLYFGNCMTVVVFVDDTLFFGADGNKIDEVITKLEDKVFTLTREDINGNIFAFLGVELSENKDQIVMIQQHLIKKVLEATDLSDCNPRQQMHIQRFKICSSSMCQAYTLS